MIRTALLGATLGALLSLATVAGASETMPYVVALDRPAMLVPVAWAEHAGAVIQCESRWRETAVNPTSGATGLLQLMRVHERRAARLGYSWGDMLRAEPNVTVAIDLWRDQNWRPWVCFQGGE